MEQNTTNAEKASGGMAKVGLKEGRSPPKPRIGSKSFQPEKSSKSNSEDGSGGMVMVGTGGVRTSPPKPIPGSKDSSPERNRPTGSDGRPIGMLGKRVATGVSQRCLQEREWGWESDSNPFGVHWRWNIRWANKNVSPREKKNTHKKNKHYPGRW